MITVIDDFINAKKQINKYFNCDEDFFIKPLINNKWTIKDADGTFFLSYWDNNKQNSCVLVKKKNKPMIFKTNQHTMVIGIECVKLAFILENNNEL